MLRLLKAWMNSSRGAAHQFADTTALEAADGALIFGVSTAMIFAVIVRLMQAHFEDLRN
jgi:hypothetical protein